MRKIILSLILLSIVIIGAVYLVKSKNIEPDKLDALTTQYTKKKSPSVDHSKLEALQKNFSSPQEVTKTCITCHTEVPKQVMGSNHWNWEREEYVKGRGIVYLGKKNAVNNFCIGVEGNEKSCAKCHIGFGVTDKMNAYTDSTNIDCLVCHDNTDTYTKGNELDGYPDPKSDLENIARHVGKTTRANCGVCHFFGGGGNNVKHGDLEKSMFNPSRDVDIHMDAGGPNLQCEACHKTENHQMLGKIYSLSSMNRNRSTCEQCHSETPHKDDILNEHTVKVACQTCHIPIYAKVNSTKMEWDWSTAGKLKNNEPYEEDDSLGNHTYLSIKGAFKWGRNVTPDYVWFNGTANHYLLGDTVTDTLNPLIMNTLNGSYSDADSKIIPVKIHKARQPYDPVTKMIIQPKLFADEKGEGAFWKDFNWKRASEVGMKEVNLPFSGNVSFINTEMYWPLNHMVSTKEKSVQCNECHTRDNSRLANLKDFYMPARDYNKFVDNTGIGLILVSIFGVIVHSAVRVTSRKKRKVKQHVKKILYI
jgi:octaheme c-type cytochrome (tetrathionate reductase family)